MYHEKIKDEDESHPDSHVSRQAVVASAIAHEVSRLDATEKSIKSAPYSKSDPAASSALIVQAARNNSIHPAYPRSISPPGRRGA
ncbi:hypothetical protein IAR50_007466 [Cryptococcus sp. DSM 104548]